MASRRFAERTGCDTCDPAEMVHPRERARWEAAGGGQAKPNWAAQMFGDTVGAVALDAAGNLAAATSTGGIAAEAAGARRRFAVRRRRACSPTTARRRVSTTGHGERIIPLVWAKAAADLVEHGDAAPQAAAAAVALLDRLDAKGGLIVLDRRGNAGVAWNTPAMAFAVWPRGATEIEDGPRE